MKHYKVTIAILLFWAANTWFILLPCHFNYCPQPDCYVTSALIYYLTIYGALSFFIWELRKKTVNSMDKRLLLATFVYTIALFVFFTVQLNSDLMTYITFIKSKFFEYFFCSLFFVLIVFNKLLTWH